MTELCSNQHPMVPPSELLKQWEDDWFEEREHADVLLIQAFQAGADQELEACCEEMKSLPNPLGIPFGEMASNALRAARRPKPPSLKEQALDELKTSFDRGYLKKEAADTIRRALEQIDD